MQSLNARSQEKEPQNFSQNLIEELALKVEQRMLSLVMSKCQSKVQPEPLANKAAAYHLQSGGRRVRARIALSAGTKLGLDQGDMVGLAACAELLHNASLIHDDLQDRDYFRRGQKTVWSVFGSQVAICAGDLLLSAAYSSLAGLRDASKLSKLLVLVHAKTADVIGGQCADLDVQNNPISNVAAYEAIAAAKSGAFLSLPLELVLIAVEHEAAAVVGRRACEAFAIGYQIADDIADVHNDRGSTEKPMALNIVFVHEAAGYGANSLATARQLGLAHLHEARNLTKLLPKGAGDYLHELSLRLSEQL